MPSSQTGKYQRPDWHKYLWIPVGICIVIVLLFVFGVLGPGGPAPEEEPTASVVLPTPTADVAATPSPSAPPPSPTALQEEPEPMLVYGKPLYAPQTRYEIAMTLHEELRRLHGTMRVNYTNTTGEPLYELVFHLHPNAFQAQDSPGAQAEIRAYPDMVFSRGGLIVSSVSLDGEVCYFTLSNDQLLLSVPFARELPAGESVEALIEFAVDVPQLNSRFGATQLGYQLGNALPVLAVYQDGDWVRRGYVGMGDSFYSEVADYAVALRYPDTYTLACTGSIQEEETAGGMVTSYAAASKVREFSCMLVREPAVALETLGAVQIRSYALSEGSAQNGALHAKNALALFEELIGPYPYETLTVAQAELYSAAGMEYPAFIMIQRELYLAGKETELEMTIAHEVAHQYFYALVGSDPIAAPWLDEALTTYFGLLPFEQREDQAVFEGLKDIYFNQYAALGGRVDGDLSDYADQLSYSTSVYYRGGAMYNALRQELGDETFFAAIRQYVLQNAYAIATPEDLVSAFEGAGGRALTAFFEGWLQEPETTGESMP